MISLRELIEYDPSTCENSFDFTKFVGKPLNTSEEVAASQLDHSPVQYLSNSCSDERDAQRRASYPTLLFVSADERSSLAARFFCTRVVQCVRWPGESVTLRTASESFNDHRLMRYASDPERWRQLISRALSSSVEYFDSDPKLGAMATPLSIVFADCEFAGADELVRSFLPACRTFTVRFISFTERWKGEAATIEGSINVNLPLKALHTYKFRGSTLCSHLTGYLTDLLPCLCQVFAREPLEGDPLGPLRSFTPVFFTRHGQSEYNLEDRLGGDPDLTSVGTLDARDIAEFFKRQVVTNPLLFLNRSDAWDSAVGFEVWCSQLRRTRHTAEPSAAVLTRGKVRNFKSLNEIHAGICEDMTNDEVKILYPYIQTARHSDKVGFRYPNGESYKDLVRRLTPLVLDLYNSQQCVLVVAHQAILRTMLSFFGGPPIEEAVHTPCPQRAVWVCTYNRIGEPQLSTVSLPPRALASGAAPQAEKWTGW